MTHKTVELMGMDDDGFMRDDEAVCNDRAPWYNDLPFGQVRPWQGEDERTKNNMHTRNDNARCVLSPHHEMPHVDKTGKQWTDGTLGR